MLNMVRRFIENRPLTCLMLLGLWLMAMSMLTEFTIQYAYSNAAALPPSSLRNLAVAELGATRGEWFYVPRAIAAGTGLAIVIAVSLFGALNRF